MEKQKFTRLTIEVPAEVLAEVAVLLLEADITPAVTAADEDNDTVTLEVEHGRHQKEVISEVREIIENYHDDEQEDD